ncbi:MAG: biopolymer transporter ExbD [Gemmataceae bacterium]|nr:biopolymer transporter ExbD [Gemmataceae bacterium]MDW8244574.1 biopolymer transporter ExbD [Thermogemmata sp.]
MSHGNIDRGEPNFTPLLDLVLQLIMFFMLSANFVMEQTAVEIRLPESIAAKAVEKTAESIFFLNINKEGRVILTPDQWEGDVHTLDNPIQVENYLRRRANEEKRRTKSDKLETVLILRVDRETEFRRTFEIMNACRRVGYERVQLRAILHGTLD